jgi:hypothetical protein
LQVNSRGTWPIKRKRKGKENESGKTRKKKLVPVFLEV